METNENFADQPAPTPGLELTNEAMVDLLEARKWAHLIAIIGFIGLGFIVVAGLIVVVFLSAFSGNSDLPFPGGIIGLLYIGMALLYFFPLLYLFRFSKSAQAAVLYRSPAELSNSIKNLKAHYQFVGILMICLIGIYIVAIAFGSIFF